MPELSVIIPSHNDIYLHKTIASLLDNSELDIEIVVVLDGYIPKDPITDDPRVLSIYYEDNRGMREAINTGITYSMGKYIMRVDEHCMFGPGYDRILLADIEDNWIVTPRRYKLDPVKWEVMNLPPIDYEKLVIKADPHKFSGVQWKSREIERKDIMVDETMSMQGSCWVMNRSWWDKVIVRLDSEGYGTLYQDSTEMLFKTWKAGGKLMVNKNTWFAHKHRDFNRTHNYPGEKAKESFSYALNLWMQDYVEVQRKWMV